MNFKISNLEGLRLFAEQLAIFLQGGELFLLDGTLGAGKTTFVRSVSEALGTTDNVCSPTFSLIQRYKSALSIVHMDLYRLESERELDFLDIEELLNNKDIKFIEWGMKFPEYFDQPYILIRLTVPERDKNTVEETNLEVGEQRVISFSIHNTQKSNTSLNRLFGKLEKWVDTFEQ